MAPYVSLRSSPSGHQTHQAEGVGCKGWVQVCLFFCILCTVIYIPLFYTISLREDKNFTWNVNSTRDVATYVQPENVTAIIPNDELCSSVNSAEREISSPPFLLVVICSAVQNFRERQAIRQTWMSMDYFNWTAPVPIRSAFLLGRNFNESLQSEVMAESKTHGDIIQEGFVDSYLNLTLKSVMLLKWVKTHCPQVTFVLKTDDDMFVNIPALVDFLLKPEVHHRTDLIVGSLFCRVKPIKDLSSKWYSPKFMFNEREYPDYVSGTGYVLSGQLIPNLFESSLKVPLFHLEDVFVTGLVARKAGVAPENYHLFSYLKHSTNDSCLYRKLITSHGLTPMELRSVWRGINDPLLDCSSVKLPKIGEPKVKKCRRSVRGKAAAAPVARHRFGRAG